jgi:hypothetical protein
MRLFPVDFVRLERGIDIRGKPLELLRYDIARRTCSEARVARDNEPLAISRHGATRLEDNYPIIDKHLNVATEDREVRSRNARRPFQRRSKEVGGVS